MSKQFKPILTQREMIIVSVAVMHWCDRHAVMVDDDDGQRAIEAAIKIMRRRSSTSIELLAALENSTRTLH